MKKNVHFSVKRMFVLAEKECSFWMKRHVFSLNQMGGFAIILVKITISAALNVNRDKTTLCASRDNVMK